LLTDTFAKVMSLIRPFFALFALALWSQAQEISSAVSVQQRTAGTNSEQEYFLIEHKSGTEPGKALGLILILPGGPGSADFLPFCANVLMLYGIPADFVVAELVAPQWSKDENRVVWPGRAFPDPHSQFTSEEFLAAVTKDVCGLRKIDERYIFTLGWSSSGHVLYSVSLSDPRVRGSIIAMSRFLPARLGKLDQARGKNYFLYHSPEDQICPFNEAQLAEQMLKEHGAKVKLVSYSGGHGWAPNTYYCDRIKEGIEWLRGINSGPQHAADGSQPVRSATNGKSAAAGSRR
jgi:predicted esterase